MNEDEHKKLLTLILLLLLLLLLIMLLEVLLQLLIQNDKNILFQKYTPRTLEKASQ